MSDQYAREILRRNVAQICQTIGWNGIHSTPLDILVHLLEKYLRTLGTQTNRYAEQFNRTEPNLHDLGLVFRDLNVQIPELAEYTRSVPPVPPPVHVEKFPKPKESNLNFLKPGSHEVVTRPMHVHEHLPPMYPEKERDTPVVAGTVEIQQNGVDNADNSNTACTSPEISVTGSPEKSKDLFKRPSDPISLPNSKRPRIRLEEEERTREISSVMMTMSGFLSPAREGKLPEARPPTIISEKHYDKHKVNSHSHPAKIPIVEKSDKKSKKSKVLNGKIVKSKRKDKSHKGESNKIKDLSKSKLSKYPAGHLPKAKGSNQLPNNLIPPPKGPPAGPIKPPIGPPSIPSQSEVVNTAIKQEPVELVTQVQKSQVPGEEAIPVPRKIPISKSPLVSNSASTQKPSSSSLITDTEIKKETIDEEEKLASQPDRSKINIFKRITNKSKEDKSASEVPEKSQPDALISKLQNSIKDTTNEVNTNENVRKKGDDRVVNNNDNSAVDLSKEMDLRAHEVINVDDDSLDITPVPEVKIMSTDTRPTTISVSKTLHPPYSKDVASVSPKVKKEKKHKDKKDKAAKLEAKLIKKQQQALAFEMAQADKHSMKSGRPPKSSRPKNESKVSQIPPGFPFFPGMSASSRNVMPGPGLIPTPSLIPGSDFLAGLTNNPALRGLQPSNLLTNPFALGTSGPGLIPGPGFLPGNLGPGIPNPLMTMSSYPHASRTSSVKIPPMLRRPSLEVIPVDNDDDRSIRKSPVMSREKDRHDKHKSTTIPNILQKHHKKSHKDHKSQFKMPPVQPDITIELNPPKDIPRQEHPKETPPPTPPPRPPPPPARSPTPEPVKELPKPEEPPSDHIKPPHTDVAQHKETEVVIEKKKDKSHKKEKKDKDGIKIKKKKDKKDKNKDKSEKKREKEERHELKEKIKKEKKEKKKEKSNDCLVPKLTLKLNASNSNSPMPPSSPDVFKLNIKPVIKKEEPEGSPLKEEPISSREHSRSPELAQISALVTRPPKQKNAKPNHAPESEAQSSSPPSGSSPTRKNRPPSSHSKYKRILFKPLSKKGHFEDDMASDSVEEPTVSQPPLSTEKPAGPLPTPYYLDEHGNKIWVCPACGRPDNGSPMIGCDGCDGWYHWVCVGITEEPGATEDWFCKSCVAKRTAMMLAGVTSGKKRGRKPKVDKIRDCH